MFAPQTQTYPSGLMLASPAQRYAVNLPAGGGSVTVIQASYSIAHGPGLIRKSVALVAIFIQEALRVLPTRSFLNIAYDVIHDLVLGHSPELIY